MTETLDVCIPPAGTPDRTPCWLVNNSSPRRKPEWRMAEWNIWADMPAPWHQTWEFFSTSDNLTPSQMHSQGWRFHSVVGKPE